MGDPRLGRRIQFDEESRKYGIRALLPTIHKPRSYTWKTGPALNQGNTSSCVGHAIAHEAAARPVSVKNVTHATAMEIYRRALQLDPWEGEADEGTSVLAGIKAAMERGWYTGYRWGFSLADTLDTLGYFGPCVLGIPWYEAMEHPDSSGRIKPEGDVIGGHGILAMGVSVPKKLVQLQNSRPAGWGINGHCFISFDHLDRLLHEQGESCIPVKRMLGTRK